MYLAIIILPLLGSIASGFFGRKIGVSGAQIITCTAVVTTTILAVLAFFEVGLNNIPVSIEVFRWIDSESLNVSWGFHFDSLTVCYVAILIEIEAVLVWIQLYKNMFILWISRLVMSDKTKNNPAYLPCPSNSYGLKGFRCKYPFTSIFPNRKKINYSTINNIKQTEQEIGAINPEFLQWFVGFTDAEGSFTINSHLKKDKFTISSFSFMFKIALHKDDEKVLRDIKDRLRIGGVRIYKDECIFSVTDKKGIALLIDIFDKYNLNTSKYLDYLDFKKAFHFYSNRSEDLNPYMIKDTILELKNKMNTSRINFDRPNDSEIVITKSWLLGFVEGDGSFFLKRDSLTPVFAIEVSGVQLPVFVKIKEFLENNLGFDSYSFYKLKNSSTIAVAEVKARNANSKSSVTLIIKNINGLNNYLVPFFADMEFLTKKGIDFKDFKIICKAIYDGAHRKQDIRALILKLSNTMNNFRLSTYKGIAVALTQEEIEKLLNAGSTVERLLDGRVIDRDTKKVLPRQVSCIYQICEQDGAVLLANSLTEAAAIVGLYPDTLSKYLDSEQLNGEFIEIKNHKIKRVCVFS